ncbi:glycosyltransferase [Zhihengliuella halotolerans]
MGIDQSPPSSPLDRARAFRLTQDVESSVDEFLRLRAIEASLSQRVRKVEHEIQQANADRARLKRELSKVKQRNERLQELYDNQTARVEKFKAAYERLRDDPAVRMSKVLARPQAAFARVRDVARKTASNASESQRSMAAPVSAGPNATTVSSSNSAPVRPAVAAHPDEVTRKSLLAAARQAFFVRGAVIEARDLLMRMQEEDLPDGPAFTLTDRDRSFMGQVYGFARFVGQLPFIPPRSATPGYQPIHQRLMYCAHSTGEFNSNGYSTRTSGLVNGLAANGEDVFVAARPGYPWDSKTTGPSLKPKRSSRGHNGVQHIYNPGPNLARTPLDVYLHQAADIYVREAMLNRPALIHSASNYFTALPALLAARRLGVPFVYEVRGLWEITEAASKGTGWTETEKFGIARDLEALVAREADQVLAITEEVRDELIRRGVSTDRIQLVPNAADPAKFVPVSRDRWLASKLGIQPEHFVIGYAGSMVPYEGLDVLVDAFAKFAADNDEARLLLVGDGASFESLKGQVRDLGLSEKVLFTGRVESDEIPRYLSLFDVAPCPRISNLVTEMVSPLKPLEAMAAGIAVVGSDVAPLKHLLGEDGRRGLLFEAGNAEALAEKLAELFEDESLRADIGRTARWWAVHERSWTAVAERVAAAHEPLLAAVETGATEHGRESDGDRPLSTMRVGIIADEFTTTSLDAECTLIRMDRESWQQQLDAEPIDALLVESAWEGNGGQWRRGVGFYSDEEFESLASLLAACGDRGIPTIFWNKEDPVHIGRFVRTAGHFDHVFTTDADCIPRYAAEPGQRAKSIAALPFFAQPLLHNPTPSQREYAHSVAYGGSYYGDRYPDRSKELARILGEVAEHGLTIYDRQVNHPGSPYQFPGSLSKYVRGGLSYPEMVEAYKAHPVHVNVNSVAKSPTMFSRRVMELAACGTPVITGSGMGVPTFFAPHLPLATSPEAAGLLANYWLKNEAGRNHDAWTLHRLVYRAHLAGHRLALMLRTAGIPVSAPVLNDYALTVDDASSSTASAVLRQTHRPAAVVVPEDADRSGAAVLEGAGIQVVTDVPDGVPAAGFGAYLNDELLGEDLSRGAWLSAVAQQDGAGTVQVSDSDLDRPGLALLNEGSARSDRPWLGAAPVEGEAVALLRRALAVPRLEEVEGPESDHDEVDGPRTVLIAGHDLKFAGQLIDRLRGRGHTILIDEWQDHGKHDPETSYGLLEQADVVFCEWSLGNAEWYAKNVKKRQRLVARFHSQELFTPYPERTQLGRIDQTVFVGRLVEQMATTRYNYAEASTRVVPNAVDEAYFDADKTQDARFNLGLVGIVPQQKHLDRALDVLAELRSRDDRFQLFVKGRTPEDYPWMLKREREMAYYDAQRARIENDPNLRGAVHFDGHGDDMGEWYRKIGVVLSVSDFESFHLTLADGGASGALPVSLAWPGAEEIYPESWLHLTTDGMASTIATVAGDEESYQRASADAREYCRRFAASLVLDQLETLVMGAGD